MTGYPWATVELEKHTAEKYVLYDCLSGDNYVILICVYAFIYVCQSIHFYFKYINIHSDSKNTDIIFKTVPK